MSFVPGEPVIWVYQAGGAYVRCLPATVLGTGKHRVRIAATLPDGTPVVRSVSPGSLTSRRRESPESGLVVGEPTGE